MHDYNGEFLLAFVYHRFVLNEKVKKKLQEMKPEFGYNGFGEIVFYRTYSRKKIKDNNKNKNDTTKNKNNHDKNNQSSFQMESWADVVIRVVEGTFSIRKDWYVKNHIEWDENYWQQYAEEFAYYMFDMKWLPPGRGLWMAGTDFIYQYGSMALQNCCAITINDNIAERISWLMDGLMLGVGVGFQPIRNDNFKTYHPKGKFDYIIPDSREGWVESVRLLINAFCIKSRTNVPNNPQFDYSEIRPEGEPIKGFGGTASGPEPLKILHDQIRYFFYRYTQHTYNIQCNINNPIEYYDSVMLKTDIANAVGCCVVAGNTRRSAELALNPINDNVFLDLKNKKKYPYRQPWQWMSNNAATLEQDEDFEKLNEIATRVIANGEPSILNLRNFPYGRIGKRNDKKKFDIRPDKGRQVNPCSEMILEGDYGEQCCLADTVPTRCETPEEWLKSCEYATFYASTITLLPTHQPEVNKVIARNRRIGIGIIDFIGFKTKYGTNQVIKWLRKGYKKIRETNKELNQQAGVPEAIRVTTIKPNGTTAKMVGKRSGMNFANFKYMIRRIRVQQYSSMYNVLHNAGYSHEPDVVSMNTEVFEIPIPPYDDAKTIDEVSVWEQVMNLILLQREWSDNAVSNTILFKPKWILIKEVYSKIEGNKLVSFYFKAHHERLLLESDTHKVEIINEIDVNGNEVCKYKFYEYNERHEEDDLESVLSMTVPHIKSLSVLPHTPKGVYAQMPESEITEHEYNILVKKIKPIDWTEFINQTVKYDNQITPVDLINVLNESEKYCTGDKCET